MERTRCAWCLRTEAERGYHDIEWGVPLSDDRRTFEFIVLEGAQAGLSWRTILLRRESYRKAFDGFDMETVASYGERKVASLLADPGIIRNRLKVRSAIENARAALRIVERHGSLAGWLWGLIGGRPVQNAWRSMKEIPATTPLSDLVSREMRKAGFSFVGSTIVYAHMQATGMVNDHVVGCFRHAEVRRIARGFEAPS